MRITKLKSEYINQGWVRNISAEYPTIGKCKLAVTRFIKIMCNLNCHNIAVLGTGECFSGDCQYSALLLTKDSVVVLN